MSRRYDDDDRWPDSDDALDDVPAAAVVEPEAPEEEEEDDDVGAEAEPAVDDEEEEDAPEHAAGELEVPDGYTLIEGNANGSRRSVAVVVARFNGAVTQRLLDTALDELEAAGVRQEAITVMPVPGAFELPLAAMALAKTRKYACIVALGAVVRGETPHFEYISSEAASGLQLAALETGVPVAFGVLTTETVEQAEERIPKAAEAVQTALEMADIFAQLRVQAAAR